MYFALKIFISALIIVTVSEVAKRFPWFAAVIASLPMISILAMIWLFHDTGSVEKVSALSHGIFWMVLPSLLFFLVLPLLLKTGLHFGWAMLLASLIMLAGYALYLLILRKMGISFP